MRGSCFHRSSLAIHDAMWAALLSLVSMLLISVPAAGQVLRGRVIDSATESVVAGATVTLLDALGAVRATAEVDDSGECTIRAPAVADYRLRVERLGYETATLGPLRIAEIPTEVVIRMNPVAVPLDTLSAEAEGRVPALARVGFYDRQTLGHGRFIERVDIEKRQARRVSDLLRGIPGLRVITDGSSYADIRLRAGGLTSFSARPDLQCLPPIYLDGMLVSHGNQGPGDRYNLNTILPQDIEAVEIYAGPAQVPPQYGGANAACGVVLFWTRK